MIASALCKVAGRDVPILPGCEKPMLVQQQQLHAPQAAALPRWQHETHFPQGEAVQFLRQTIRNNPGEVVLLTIGPLTNIGLLFTLDPKISSLLKGLVMMCGVFTNRLGGVGPVEWNIEIDPHAAAIVYQATPPIHRSIGLDVTSQVTMTRKELCKRFHASLLKPVVDFAGTRFQHQDQIIFHDPLAATTLFDDTICRFTKGNVEIELQNDRLRGLTYWKPGSRAHHEIALEVNSARFFDHFTAILH
jgi:purine nucleosidase